VKVLVVAVPAAGHLHPLLPLVEALLAQGDEVVVATAEDQAGVVARSGAAFVPAGHGEMDWFGKLQGHVRGAPGDGLAPGRINHYFFPRLFAEIAAADQVDDVLAAGQWLHPDLVVFETYALAGPLVADLLGVPGVHHLIGPMLPSDVIELGNDAVSPIWRSFGRDVPGHAGLYRGLTIEITPPSLEAEVVPGGNTIGLQPAPPPARTPSPLTPPLVYLTLGTFFGANVGIFQAALEGLAAEPVQIVVTVGADGDPAALGPVPANAQVQRFIPQAALLPDCSAVIHHAGAGTMFGSLTHGLPQVVVPQGADNFVNGELLSKAGAGVALYPDEVTPDRIREAVRTVLGEPSYAAAAGRLAAEIAAMPTAPEVARTLAQRVAGRSSP